MSFTPDEVRYLATHERSIAELQETLTLSKKDSIKEAELLRREHGEFGRAVGELLQARASHKLPENWLMDIDAAQQATPLPVARVRAERIAKHKPGLVHDVTCSVGTEATAYSEEGYIGSDLDYSRVLMARHNLGRRVFQADALHPSSTAEVIIADPARRAQGRRITSPNQLLPPLPELLRLPGELAVKCAPGLDFSEWDGLVSVMSVDGGVKEACLYTPALSGPERREAVVITDRGVDKLSDLDPSAPELADAPGTYLVDPDGAVVRAGLVRQFAVREGLWMLDERIAYLTGDRIPAGYSGFRILEKVPVKQLRQTVQKYDCGSLEILVRGLDVDPDQLRKKLKLKGNRPMAAVLTRIGTQGVALVCEAREWACES